MNDEIVTELLAALEPFARCSEVWPGYDDYNRVLYWARHGVRGMEDLSIRVCDLRRAAEARGRG